MGEPMTQLTIFDFISPVAEATKATKPAKQKRPLTPDDIAAQLLRLSDITETYGPGSVMPKVTDLAQAKAKKIALCAMLATATTEMSSLPFESITALKLEQSMWAGWQRVKQLIMFIEYQGQIVPVVWPEFNQICYMRAGETTPLCGMGDGVPNNYRYVYWWEAVTQRTEKHFDCEGCASLLPV